MFLVHRGKQNPNRWEVAWTWLPYFLAADQLLHRAVDKAMTAKWKGIENPGLHEVRQMHQMVIDLILERYPIEGLKTYLGAVLAVQLDDGVVPTPPEARKEEGMGLVNPSVVLQVPPRTEGEPKKIDPVLLDGSGGDAA